MTKYVRLNDDLTTIDAIYFEPPPALEAADFVEAPNYVFPDWTYVNGEWVPPSE